MASKGQIHDVFRTNLEEIVEQALDQAHSARGNGARSWNRPDKIPDPLNIPGITAAYDRSQVDVNYGELIKSGDDPGTCGDVICVKTQGDYIAIMERAYRARHATPVRCIGHAMARRKGHSDDAGVFMGGVLVHVQDALQAGQSAPSAAMIAAVGAAAAAAG